MAESGNTYVKIGQRGRLIERIAASPRDHVNLRATGWFLKGSKGAPTEKDETVAPPASSGLTDLVPTSQRALADAAEPDNTSGKKTSVATGAGSAAATKSSAVAKS